MAISREHFLKAIWTPYPAAPLSSARQQVKHGRILALSPSQISLHDGAPMKLSHSTRMGTARSGEVGGPSICDILRAGDLVALLLSSETEVAEVQLLAPALQAAARKLPSREILDLWSHFSLQVKLFFIERGFLEASTPSLVNCPGTEPFVDVFTTELQVGRQATKLFLPTSPELHLKKMLAADLGPLFEIKNCFRNGEITSHHQPEFTMLEWYRPYADLNPILEDLEDLLLDVTGLEELPLLVLSMRELLAEVLEVEISPQDTRDDYLQLANDLGLHTHSSDSIADLFHRIFVEKVEPAMPPEQMLVVRDFPPFLAAYAKLTPEGWADRFELYWQGLEIANAFNEVNDPALQRERMLQDLQLKREIGKQDLPLDEEFLQALQSGMPPSGGIALGMERLFMAINQRKDIAELKAFPYR